MKKNLWAVAVLLAALPTGVSRADVVAGDDLDGGVTNGGFVPVSRVLNPDNTEWNGLFGATGSFFDRFGIATIDIDMLGDSVDLPFDVVDQSLVGFPGDRWGVIREDKTDHVFVMVDLENPQNATSPNASGSWTFNIADFEDLSLSIDLGMVGDFGTDGGGRSDRFTFSYSIDGGASQTLMAITSTDDDRAYVVTMADGAQYMTGDPNFFFDEFEYGLLGCTLGVAGSCADEVDVFGDGSNLVFPDGLDVNRDGHIYEDTGNIAFTDTPLNAGDLNEGVLRIYGETNSNGTFSNPEFDLFKNPLMVNGDTNRLIGNQLSTFTEAIAGTGSTLTLTLEAEQYGGDQYFVFDNILIEGVPSGGVTGDFNGDGEYDCLDVDALVGDIASGNNSAEFDLTGDSLVDADDLAAWLAEAGTNNVGAPFLLGDANLNGVVDVSDFNVWNGSKFESIAEWCSGDFNADGVVDVSDFNIWNGNKFQASGGPAAVPEPAALGLVLLGLLGALHVRR